MRVVMVTGRCWCKLVANENALMYNVAGLRHEAHKETDVTALSAAT